jgi:hypothetical protein
MTSPDYLPDYSMDRAARQGMAVNFVPFVVFKK